MKKDYDEMKRNIDRSLPLYKQLEILGEVIHLEFKEKEREDNLRKKREELKKQEKIKKQREKEKTIDTYNLERICDLFNIMEDSKDIYSISLRKISFNNKTYNIEKRNNDFLTINCDDKRDLSLSIYYSSWEETDGYFSTWTAERFTKKFTYHIPSGHQKIDFNYEGYPYVEPLELAKKLKIEDSSKYLVYLNSKDNDEKLENYIFTKEELAFFTKILTQETERIRIENKKREELYNSPVEQAKRLIKRLSPEDLKALREEFNK